MKAVRTPLTAEQQHDRNRQHIGDQVLMLKYQFDTEMARLDLPRADRLAAWDALLVCLSKPLADYYGRRQIPAGTK